ncbi:hypothetical protein [Sebaldella sp. S0638]|uniref:hypothetical protein n=1 Tax=Sebaldella sp. S0638 TaxID=2957809 RepID=UPI00209CAC90|nr:hypothetical protein [Sebaldella sp. S0638]MCP1223935.1 hypothetical protein [Sebaldella sp. S0638]
MKEITKLFKNIDKLVFMSSSMGNSEMDWNYNGTGNTKVTCENDKIFFLDRITIDDRLSYEDKKMWVVNGDELEFWHFRNNEYEKIFTFSKWEHNTLMAKEYLCADDVYMGKVEVDNEDIIFMIEIKSQKKNELIKYKYFK